QNPAQETRTPDGGATHRRRRLLASAKGFRAASWSSLCAGSCQRLAACFPPRRPIVARALRPLLLWLAQVFYTSRSSTVRIPLRCCTTCCPSGTLGLKGVFMSNATKNIGIRIPVELNNRLDRRSEEHTSELQ